MKFGCLVLAGFLTFTLSASLSRAQSSAISYQGNLQSGGLSVSGPFDLTFAVFPALSGDTQIGSTVTNLGVLVTNGFFNTMMDFGTNTFLGSNRWIEVSVRTNGSNGSFSTLSPRQPVAAAPFALYALRSGSGPAGPPGPGGTNGANGVSGTTGQNATTVYGTDYITISTTTETLIPGLSQSFTVPTNAITVISTDGSFRTTSPFSTGYSEVEVYVKIGPAEPTNGFYADLYAVNTTGVTGVANRWSFSKAISLPPGTNSVGVYTYLAAGTAATVSGGPSTTDQGELTVMFLKQ